MWNCAEDVCENEPAHTVDIYCFGESMQTWLCPEHMGEVRATGVPVIDHTDRHGVYPEPNLPLVVVIVGGVQ